MREQFAEILKQTQNNQIAQMDLVIDNETYFIGRRTHRTAVV